MKNISEAIDVVVQNVVASTDKNAALVESLKFCGPEMLKLDNEHFHLSIKELKSKLEDSVPEIAVALPNGGFEMNGPTRKLIAQTINGLPVGCNTEKRDILIRAITDYDEMQTSTVIGNSVGVARPK
jgi:argonaute-like protein implicated in RNA metabolism and viral defense